MEHKQLGDSGVVVPEIGLGVAAYKGGPAPLRKGVSLGAVLIDTAESYRTEDAVGDAIRGIRDQVFIATKVSSSHFRYDDVIDAADKSLRRLGTDRIDLYQLHRPTSHIAIDETLRAMDDLVSSGKIRYAGTSNFGSWQVVESLWASEKLGLGRFVSEQSPFNLADRRAEREHIPMCRTHGLAFIPWSPLAAGGLTGKYKRVESQATGTRFGDETDPGKMKRFSDGVMNIADGLAPIAEAHSATVAQVSLAWVAAQPGVTAPIIGPRTMEQLEDNLGALDVELTADDFAAIDRLAQPGTNAADFYEASFKPNDHRF